MKWWLGVLGAAGLAFGAAGQAQAQSNDLLFLSYNVPNSLNVDGPGGTFAPSYGGMLQLLEPLVSYEKLGANNDGVIELDFDKFSGRLAESWDFDEDSLTWTFNLKRGITGCSGETFNADDVLYTFARAKSISGASPVGYFLANVGSIDAFTPALFGARVQANKAKEEGKDPPSPDARDLGAEVTKVDDYTVRITQSSPNKLFLPVLSIFALMIYDKETMEANATEDDPWSHTYANTVNAPGFGPYCLESWEKEESFTLKANPNYHGGKPFYDRVLVRKVPESSNRLAILRSGQAQIVEALTPKEFQSLRNTRGIKVGGAYTNSTMTMSMNWTQPPFDNIKLRQAIAHAIPYQQIIDNVYFGDAKKWDGVIPSIYPGYHETKTKYNYDPEKAKALLAEAGFPGGKGLDAFPNAFKIAFVSERESIVGPAITMMRTALREIGIPIELDPMPLSQYSDRQFVKKDLPMAINDTSRPFGVDAAYSVLLHFVTVAKGGLNNWGNYSNERVDELYNLAKLEGDETKRDALLAEAQEILMAEVAWISIVEYKTQFAWREELTGVTLHPEGQLRFVDLEE